MSPLGPAANSGVQPTWLAAFLPTKLCHHGVAGHAAEPWSVGRLNHMRWVIYVLFSLIIALIPCVIWPEMIMPYDVWESWDSNRRGVSVEYSGKNVPPVVRNAARVFATIVLPPAAFAESLGYRRTAYGDLASSISGLNQTGIANHYTPPVTIAAVEHLAVAFPFWFAVVTIVGEGGLRLRRARKLR